MSLIARLVPRRTQGGVVTRRERREDVLVALNQVINHYRGLVLQRPQAQHQEWLDPPSSARPSVEMSPTGHKRKAAEAEQAGKRAKVLFSDLK